MPPLHMLEIATVILLSAPNYLGILRAAQGTSDTRRPLVTLLFVVLFTAGAAAHLITGASVRAAYLYMWTIAVLILDLALMLHAIDTPKAQRRPQAAVSSAGSQAAFA